MILELHSLTYIRILFGHCHVTFSYKEILSLFGYCQMTFPYKELLSFWVGLYKNYNLFFRFFFRKRHDNQMAAVILQVIASFHTNYSKNTLFLSANTYENYIVTKEYCVARHDDKMCILPNCRFHIILIGNI